VPEGKKDGRDDKGKGKEPQRPVPRPTLEFLETEILWGIECFMQHQLVLSYLITEWKGKCNDLEDL